MTLVLWNCLDNKAQCSEFTFNYTLIYMCIHTRIYSLYKYKLGCDIQTTEEDLLSHTHEEMCMFKRMYMYTVNPNGGTAPHTLQ